MCGLATKFLPLCKDLDAVVVSMRPPLQLSLVSSLAGTTEKTALLTHALSLSLFRADTANPSVDHDLYHAGAMCGKNSAVGGFFSKGARLLIFTRCVVACVRLLERVQIIRDDQEVPNRGAACSIKDPTPS